MSSTAEQDPEEIFAAVVKTVRRLMEAYVLNPSQVLGLCFSAAMHSLILVDADR
jgi:gluconokinase